MSRNKIKMSTIFIISFCVASFAVLAFAQTTPKPEDQQVKPAVSAIKTEDEYQWAVNTLNRIFSFLQRTNDRFKQNERNLKEWNRQLGNLQDHATADRPELSKEIKKYSDQILTIQARMTKLLDQAYQSTDRLGIDGLQSDIQQIEVRLGKNQANFDLEALFVTLREKATKTAVMDEFSLNESGIAAINAQLADLNYQQENFLSQNYPSLQQSALDIRRMSEDQNLTDQMAELQREKQKVRDNIPGLAGQQDLLESYTNNLAELTTALKTKYGPDWKAPGSGATRNERTKVRDVENIIAQAQREIRQLAKDHAAELQTLNALEKKIELLNRELGLKEARRQQALQIKAVVSQADQRKLEAWDSQIGQLQEKLNTFRSSQRQIMTQFGLREEYDRIQERLAQIEKNTELQAKKAELNRLLWQVRQNQPDFLKDEQELTRLQAQRNWSQVVKDSYQPLRLRRQILELERKIAKAKAEQETIILQYLEKLDQNAGNKGQQATNVADYRRAQIIKNRMELLQQGPNYK
jgi:chromosome segregation ATPase